MFAEELPTQLQLRRMPSNNRSIGQGIACLSESRAIGIARPPPMTPPHLPSIELASPAAHPLRSACPQAPTCHGATLRANDWLGARCLRPPRRWMVSMSGAIATTTSDAGARRASCTLCRKRCVPYTATPCPATYHDMTRPTVAPYPALADQGFNLMARRCFLTCNAALAEALAFSMALLLIPSLWRSSAFLTATLGVTLSNACCLPCSHFV